ncbi:MAG: hypothetical protein ACP5NK_06490 [Thermoplasmata archaeon]
MSHRLLVIISSGQENKEKAITGLIFAREMKKNNRSEKVGLIFFGPSERLIASGDKDIDETFKTVREAGIEPFACSGIAKRDNIEPMLAQRNIAMEPISKVIARYLDDGFVPITF